MPCWPIPATRLPGGRWIAPLRLHYFNLAAHAQGLGCCWGGVSHQGGGSFRSAQRIFRLEADQTVQGALVFGQPDLDYLAVPVRNPVQVRWL